MSTTTPLLPSLFVSHGAPLFAIEPGTTGPALASWAKQLTATTALRGVVVLSPHWMTRGPSVMTNPAPETWHDFGGFPPALYQLKYPAVGHAALGNEVIDLLTAAGMPAVADETRPMDHGTWVPLMHLLPKADVPVVQVALPVQWGPKQVYQMGAALASLRASGVLIIGSGSMTHNLAEFFGGAREPAPYVIEFSRWIEAAVTEGRWDDLLNYRAMAPHATRAHPSEDHFLPLFFALGAAGQGARPSYISREIMYSMLAMDAFSLESETSAVQLAA